MKEVKMFLTVTNDGFKGQIDIEAFKTIQLEAPTINELKAIAIEYLVEFSRSARMINRPIKTFQSGFFIKTYMKDYCEGGKLERKHTFHENLVKTLIKPHEKAKTAQL